MAGVSRVFLSYLCILPFLLGATSESWRLKGSSTVSLVDDNDDKEKLRFSIQLTDDEKKKLAMEIVKLAFQKATEEAKGKAGSWGQFIFDKIKPKLRPLVKDAQYCIKHTPALTTEELYQDFDEYDKNMLEYGTLPRDLRFKYYKEVIAKLEKNAAKVNNQIIKLKGEPKEKEKDFLDMVVHMLKKKKSDSDLQIIADYIEQQQQQDDVDF